ncbi:MAG: FkbM family methyltransferase, partial [Dehalococcoidia bacterium]|nr:FkbM family methyltransferase [Dehalococcoidia bacterium]
LTARQEVERLFSSTDGQSKRLGFFGEMVFPYHKMGAVDSLNLFDLDELIIFSFYWVNRARYKRVLDIGANIGLHSIILSKCGFEVHAYEPDPRHFEVLQRNLRLNNCSNVRPFNLAVSSESGEKEFIRLLGNTTGSHLAGSKPNPYGDLERFPVKVEPFGVLMTWADLIKLDVEGHEKEILLNTSRDQWLGRDALVEVQSEENALSIYKHFDRLGVCLFSQKTNWQQVQTFDDMPTSHHEGTLFVSCSNKMFWQDMESVRV